MQPKYNTYCADKMETRIGGGGRGRREKELWIGLDRIGLDWMGLEGRKKERKQKKNAYSVNLLYV